VPELASHPRLTRAQVVLSDVDLLQLTAAVRVLEIEAKVESPEKSSDDVVENLEADGKSD
jgi:exoribonuclease-2